MKEIDTEELKRIQVDMLEKIHEFCTNNKINYFLSYGSLIGAVRHKGYIPWDDDIDISMPRPDYDIFIHSFNGKFSELSVLAPELNWNFFEPYANVYDNRTILLEDDNLHHGVEIGIKIDIFPIDGVPNDKKKYKTLRKKILRLNWLRGIKKESLFEQLMRIYKTKHGFKSLIYRFMHPFIKYEKIQKKIHELALECDYNSSEYVESIVFQPKCWTQKKKEFYNDFIDVKFERLTLKAPKNYDSYLKMIYGDYMKLPPEKERVYSHGFTAYWKE